MYSPTDAPYSLYNVPLSLSEICAALIRAEKFFPKFIPALNPISLLFEFWGAQMPYETEAARCSKPKESALKQASEIERNLISQRTKEALAIKRISGIKLGRPSRMTPKVRKLSDEIEMVRARIEKSESKSSIAREYGVHRNTLDKCLRS